MNWNNYISKTAQELPASGIRKIWEMALSMDNVLSLGVGEPDYAPPQKVLDAAIKSLENKETSYTSNAGLLPLLTAIRKWYGKRYGVDYTENEMMLTVGASEAIDLAMRVLLDEGDEVLIPDPSYVAYAAEVKLNKGVAVMVPTHLKKASKLHRLPLKKRLLLKLKCYSWGTQVIRPAPF